MGDTIAYLKDASYIDVFNALKSEMSIEPVITSYTVFKDKEFIFNFSFTYKKENRNLTVVGNGDQNKNRYLTYLRLGYWRNSVDIIKNIVKYFGGEITEVDSGFGETEPYILKKSEKFKIDKDSKIIWDFILSKDKTIKYVFRSFDLNELGYKPIMRIIFE
jgi:hypothetical protein